MLIALAVLVVTTAPADAIAGGEDALPTCRGIYAHLKSEIESMRDIPLEHSARESWHSDEPGRACDHYGEVQSVLLSRGDAGTESEIAFGMLGSRRAAVQLSGPGGSGRFWDVTIAVEGERGTVGACLTTSTVGFRSATEVREHLPRKWEPLKDDRFVLWTSIAAGDSGSSADTVLVPVVFQLKGGVLTVDPRATARAIGQFGEAYATCQKRECQVLLKPAAQAFTAWAQGRACPSR